MMVKVKDPIIISSRMMVLTYNVKVDWVAGVWVGVQLTFIPTGVSQGGSL